MKCKHQDFIYFLLLNFRCFSLSNIVKNAILSFFLHFWIISPFERFLEAKIVDKSLIFFGQIFK